MQQKMGFISAIVLALVLNVTASNANNLTFVNATKSAINVTAYFKQDTSGTLKQCVAQYYQTIQPGGVYSKDISGCLVKQVIVDIIGQGKSIWLDVPSSQRMDRGLFFIRPAVDCDAYIMEGPVVSIPPTRRLYFINTTDHDVVIDYAFLNCGGETTKFLGSLRMEVIDIPQACESVSMQGNILDVPGSRGLTGSYTTHGAEEGVFVLRQKPGTTDQFEMAGPFSDK